MKELIQRLSETYGPSGHEDRIRALIEGEIRGHCEAARTDALGNLIATYRGKGGPVTGRRILVAAHMDEIGLIVTHVDEKGFLRFAQVGGVNPSTLVGSRVIFGDGVRGVIGVERKDPPWDGAHLDRLFIDVGASDRVAAERLTSIGDVCVFDRPFAEFGDRLVAKAMDDRVCCAILIQIIKELGNTPHQVTFVFTSQEEVGVRGATTSSFAVAPEIALAVDVSPTGDTPEARRQAVTLGKGPALMVKDAQMVAHAGLRRWLTRLANDSGIPCQMEILEQGSTDAKAMQIAGEGVIAGAVSVPTRYVHTPSEMVDMQDVENTVRLLIAFLKSPVEL